MMGKWYFLHSGQKVKVKFSPCLGDCSPTCPGELLCVIQKRESNLGCFQARTQTTGSGGVTMPGRFKKQLEMEFNYMAWWVWWHTIEGWVWWSQRFFPTCKTLWYCALLPLPIMEKCCHQPLVYRTEGTKHIGQLVWAAALLRRDTIIKYKV